MNKSSVKNIAIFAFALSFIGGVSCAFAEDTPKAAKISKVEKKQVKAEDDSSFFGWLGFGESEKEKELRERSIRLDNEVRTIAGAKIGQDLLSKFKSYGKKINLPAMLDEDAPRFSVPKDGRVVELGLGKSRILDLPVGVKDVLVANPDIVGLTIRSPKLAYLLAQQIGDTNVLFMDANNEVIARLEVHVHMDVDRLKKAYRRLMPDENIKVSAVNDRIILSGMVSSDRAVREAAKIASGFMLAGTTDNLINILKVQNEQQVLLKVRVAEVQRSILKELGVNSRLGETKIGTYNLGWGGVQGGSAINNALDTLISPNATLQDLLRLSSSTGLSSTAGTLYSGVLSRGLTNNWSVTVQTLEKNGLLKTLAEPNLTAVSGETANLLAGGEYPIPVQDSNNQITFEFKPFGVGLAFTPVVLDGGRISLKMSTEVSSLSTERVTTANTSIPALNVRRASTTVEMPSGGSLMIAGLLQNDVVSNLSGIPGLKNIPILGALFSSKSFQKNESEMVVTVTSYLVEPEDPEKFSAPTDGFAPSSDFDFYLLNKLQKMYVDEDGEPPAGVIEGPIGYIMK